MIQTLKKDKIYLKKKTSKEDLVRDEFPRKAKGVRARQTHDDATNGYSLHSRRMQLFL
jgi:hypothetical protein